MPEVVPDKPADQLPERPPHPSTLKAASEDPSIQSSMTEVQTTEVNKEPVVMSKRIANVAVPQGVGDIFWVYQKIYDYFDEIHFRIFVANPEDKVEQRSVPLLKEFPKVANVVLERHRRKDVARLFNTVYHLDIILADRKEGVETFDFSCNYWLDRGHKLEDMDKNFQPNWNIQLPTEPPRVPLPGKYLVLYASGHCLKDRKLWQAQQWVELITNFNHKTGTKYPVQVIGADFDAEMMQRLKDELTAKGIETQLYVGEPIKSLCHIIKNAEYFFGYQSGLNVLADNLDTPQIMIYFNYLKAMKDSWVKPDNRTNGKFKYGYFRQTPGQIAELIDYEK